MKMKRLIARIFISAGSFFLLTVTQAGAPLWTFIPLTATSVSVPTSGSATIQYTVTNQSKKSHTLVMTPIAGISQTTTAGSCVNPFILGYQQSCTLTLQITGSALQGNVVGGPIVCQQGSSLQCYQPSAANSLNITLTTLPGQTTLATSVATLALRASGVARIITITNTGTVTAIGVTYSPSPALPAGTTITPASCGTIAPAGTCVLTITPGATPSATPGDTNPTPITLSIAGTNTNTLTPTINILAYGSVYQSGFIFAFDDTTPNTGSIGGKVAALADQASFFGGTGVIWSSDNIGNPVFDAIPGIYENSTNPPDACNGNTDGACDTGVIVAFYPTINLSFYAAGLCKATIDGYSDWYLPAICEMGYRRVGLDAGCGSQANPTLQNMQSNLVENNIGSLAGPYWSSTESSINIPNNAWDQFFAAAGVTFQDEDGKQGAISVRCVRAIT